MLRCKVLINLLNPKCRATSTFILHFALIHECIDAFYILFSALYTWFTLMWCRLESVRDFLIKLDIKLCMHLNSGNKHFFTKSCHEFESSAFAFVCFEISILLKLEIKRKSRWFKLKGQKTTVKKIWMVKTTIQEFWLQYKKWEVVEFPSHFF